MRQYAYFDELPLKTIFSYNGDNCVKQSTRTAIFTEYGRVFYFSGKDLCIVGLHDRVFDLINKGESK